MSWTVQEGKQSVERFLRKMGVTDPLAKLSAGPVHFAYSGWAYVDILPESTPSIDENCFLKYHHPFSFESHSWLQAGKQTDFAVCIMNAGYSSGWCEESFGLPLTATEITCKAKGDDTCTFVLAPPHRMREHVERELAARWLDSKSLHLEVEDSGIGIPESKTTRLFEPFVQADDSDTRRFAGTGLGLSIARRLVELMEGEIDVRSKVGKGSTFWFTIPARPLEGPTPEEPQLAPGPRRVQARVLLVEDDRTSRFVIEMILAEYGCSVDSVTNGREAVAACATGSYDIVFMDCQMPMMDGYEATARIRELQEGGATRTPIIAMTASVMHGQAERCRAAGMDDFLGKPLDGERVRAVLSRWAGAQAAE